MLVADAWDVRMFFVTAQKRMGGEFAGPLIKKTEKRVDWLKKGKRVSINSKKIVNFAAGKSRRVPQRRLPGGIHGKKGKIYNPNQK